jgi:RNA polymerase sigma-70 factor (ECF subfamily)
MPEEEKPSLVAELKQGRAEAFETLVRTYSPRLLSSATRILGSSDDARDAVQEALISAWKGIARFEGAASVYTWLHRIVMNACLTRLRSARSRKEVSLANDTHPVAAAFEELPGMWTETGPSLEKRAAMRRALQRALDQIPQDFRIVLLLRDVEELSSRETAEQLGITDTLVRQRLHRARTIMAELLRPELCEGPALTCGGQLDLLLDYIDSTLPPDLQQPVHDHIESCPACTNLLASYRTTIGIPRALVTITELEGIDPIFVEDTVKAGVESAHK